MPAPAVDQSALAKLAGLVKYLTPAEKADLDQLLTATLPIWTPLPGPQTTAYNSPADIIYYGGSAGGGKTDLLLGLALTQHKHSIIYRRQATQLIGIQSRLLDEILRSRKGWNGQSDILKMPGHTIEFGSCNNPGEEQKYQGRPHDLVCFDEIPHFTEQQFRFLSGWLRTTVEGQRCRIVCAGNPPTDTDGRWVVKYWGPWLDDTHPNPAQPGELRWYTSVNGEDVEMPGPDPVEVNGRLVKPMSRTFIPSSLTDNPYLLNTGYEATLQALPEPLRSQMLLGDFRAGTQDDAYQLFPTSWVEAAMDRWRDGGNVGKTMDSIGADIARGGADKTVVAMRYGNWYDKLKTWPGSQTVNGSTAAGCIVSCIKDQAVVHVDALGVGGETVGHLEAAGVQTVAVVGYDTATIQGETDRATGRLKFRNYRAYIHWRFREALDPVAGSGIAMFPDAELKADLCCLRWKLSGAGILVESKDEIKSRIGRSPDKSDAVVYASISTIKTAESRIAQMHHQLAKEWSPREYA
jgi:hypothetical protein